MHEAWRADPNSVHASWRAFFQNEAKGLGKGRSYTSPIYLPLGAALPQAKAAGATGADNVLVRRAIQLQYR